jgi:hypothetical protein
MAPRTAATGSAAPAPQPWKRRSPSPSASALSAEIRAPQLLPNPVVTP